MWDKLEYPPQPFGMCSICSRHDCGEVVEDGVKKQKWLHVPLELFAGGDLHIGYQCVRGMSEDLGVAVRVVEKTIHVEPSDEQVIELIRKALEEDETLGTTDEEAEEAAEITEQVKKRQRRASK